MLTEDEFKDFLKALGKRIRTLRKDKKLNMRDIMISTGYHDAQWRKYEAGGSLNIMSLMKVALALEVSLVQLLDGLGQWPLRSVSEIEAKSAAASTAPDSDDSAEQKPKTRKRLLVKSSRVADPAASAEQTTQGDTKGSSRASRPHSA